MEHTFTLSKRPKIVRKLKKPARIEWPFNDMQVGDTMRVYVHTEGQLTNASNAASGYSRIGDPYFRLRSKRIRLPYSDPYMLIRAVDAREETVAQTKAIHSRMTREAYEADLAAHEGK
jgi:hypothetical protein